MATIEELLGLDMEGVAKLEKMSDEKLAVYLKDITDVEPKARPIPLALQQAAALEEAEEEARIKAEEAALAGGCPITKSKRKPTKAKREKGLAVPDETLFDVDNW